MFKKTKNMEEKNKINLVFNGSSLTSGTGFGTTSTTTSLTNFYEKKLHDVKIIDDKEGMLIEITYKMIPTLMISQGYFQSDKTLMNKEIYGVIDGKMQKIKTISGYESPGYYVEPEIEWSE